MVLKSRSMVSSCMNESPTPRVRNIAGTTRDILLTMTDTATLMAPAKKEENGEFEIRENV